MVLAQTRAHVQNGELFVALSGPNFDGNKFVSQAHAKGAAGAVVEFALP